MNSYYAVAVATLIWPFSMIASHLAKRRSSINPPPPPVQPSARPTSIGPAIQPDGQMDVEEVRSRLLRGERERFQVTITHPHADKLLLYAGPRGADARQVFENCHPLDGETMTFIGDGVVRGVKQHGK